MSESCGCQVGRLIGEDGHSFATIIYCPLHKAAPDLLAALENALTVCDELAQEVRELDGVMDLNNGRTAVSVMYLNARAALAQAKGDADA